MSDVNITQSLFPLISLSVLGGISARLFRRPQRLAFNRRAEVTVLAELKNHLFLHSIEARRLA